MRRRLGFCTLGAAALLSGCEGVLGPSFEPSGALVAVRTSEEGVARVGPVELPSGATIRLYAVLVQTEGEESVYYTAAEKLEIDGVAVDSTALRPWPDRPLRCQWQTLQAPSPYIEIGSDERLQRVSKTNFSHPDWGLDCSTVATISARQRETLAVPDDELRLAFGRQSYQVRVEFLEKASDLFPESNLVSPGSDALLAEPESFPRVAMPLEGALEEPSKVFGLSQLEPKGDLSAEALAEIRRLHEEGLFFQRSLLLDDLLEGDVIWALTELDGSLPFVDDAEEQGIAPGDLLRVGERVMVVFRDVGQAGVLDADDLGFDFERGAIVRRIGDVFVGEGDVQWTPRRR